MNSQRGVIVAFSILLCACSSGGESESSPAQDTFQPTPDVSDVSEPPDAPPGEDTSPLDTLQSDASDDSAGPDAGSPDTQGDDVSDAQADGDSPDDTLEPDAGEQDAGEQDAGEQDAGEDTGVDTGPPADPDYLLIVEDQTTTNGTTVKVAEVRAKDYKNAVIAVFADDGGAPGALLGDKDLLLSKQTNVIVTVEPDIFDATGATVWVGLFQDLDGDNDYTDGEPLFVENGVEVMVSAVVTYTGDEVNSFTLENQTAGSDSRSVVIASADLEEKPAIVAIYDDVNGAPGELLATHWFQTANLIGKRITLSREIEGKETLWVAAFTDLDEDELLTDADPQVVTIYQEPLWASFEVKANCGPSKATKYCDPSDPGRIFWKDGCGDPSSYTSPCTTGAVCVDDGDVGDGLGVGCQFPPDPCGSPKAKKVCNPNDPSRVYWQNLCGEYHSYAVPCVYGAECAETSDGEGGATAACAFPDDGCGAPKSVKACNPADLSKVYWKDLCGAWSTYTVPCNAGTQCEESVDAGGQTTVACKFPDNPCGSSKAKKVCNPDDPFHVYWVDLCGNYSDYTVPCTAGTECTDDDPVGDGNGVGCSFPDDPCAITETIKACNPDEPNRIHFKDGCGELGTYSVPCGAGFFCDDSQDDGSGASVSCKKPDDGCGSPLSNKVCNPADLSRRYFQDDCGHYADYTIACPAGWQCDASGGGHSCEPIDDGCGAPKAVKACDPENPHVISWHDECGNWSSFTAPCGVGFECQQTDGVVQCGVIDDGCGAPLANKVCNPDDLTAIYFADDCNVVANFKIPCGASTRCDDSGDEPVCAWVDDGCGPTLANKVCNPDDPTRIYFTDLCGAFANFTVPCGATSQCTDTAEGPKCLVPDDGCGDTKAHRVCDPADLSKVFFEDDCGNRAAAFVPCGAPAACDDSSGEAACVAENPCGSAKHARVCDPAEPSRVFWVDECGNQTGWVPCGSTTTCLDEADDGTAECVEKDDGCGPVKSVSVCVEAEPDKIFWADLCGNIANTFVPCGGDAECEETPDGAACVSTAADCGAPHAHRVCHDTKPDVVFYADDCGNLANSWLPCGAGFLCEDADGAGGADATCVAEPNPCGDPKARRVCNAANPGRIFFEDECGDPGPGFELCAFDEECVEATPYAAECQAKVDPCAPVQHHKVCDPAQPGVVVWVDACGQATSEVPCGALTECSESGGTATCVSVNGGTDCGQPQQNIVCNPTDLTAIYFSDACGNYAPTTIPCPPGTACDASSGTAVCQADMSCGSPTAQAICDANDPSKVFFANDCGAKTGGAITCGSDSECDESTPGAATCKPTIDCGSSKDHKVCVPEAPNELWWADACGNVTTKFSTCSTNKQCADGSTEASCQCVLTEQTRCFGEKTIQNPSGIQLVDSCNKGADVVEECAQGEVCWESPAGPTCWASVSDPNALWYHKGCTIDQWVENPTTFPVDCRCRMVIDTTDGSGSGIPECWPHQFAFDHGHGWGTGPRIITLPDIARRVGGVVVDKGRRELLIPVHWHDGQHDTVGFLMAMNIDTGNRRIVSGRYLHPGGTVEDFGSGHISDVAINGTVQSQTIFPYIADVRIGSDGKYYVYGSNGGEMVEIIRVEPSNGHRTLVWKRQVYTTTPNAFGQCYSERPTSKSPSGFTPIQYRLRSFGLGPNNEFYLGFSNVGCHNCEGVGIARISSDGSTCTVVSRSTPGANTVSSPTVGGGWTIQGGTIQGLTWKDGKIYGYNELKQAFISFDVATGDRTLVSAKGVKGSGYPGIGQNWFFWDEGRQLWITVGTAGGEVMSAIDPSNGNRQNLMRLKDTSPLYPGVHPVETSPRGPIIPMAVNHAGVAFHPDNPNWMFWTVRQGIMLYEISTGNSYTFSL